MTTHLLTRAGILCHTAARWPARSGDLRDVSCTRCARRLTSIAADESGAAFERRRLSIAADAAESLGAGALWSLVSDAGSPTERMVRDLLAAIVVGLAEMQAAQLANTA